MPRFKETPMEATACTGASRLQVVLVVDYARAIIRERTV